MSETMSIYESEGSPPGPNIPGPAGFQFSYQCPLTLSYLLAGTIASMFAKLAKMEGYLGQSAIDLGL